MDSQPPQASLGSTHNLTQVALVLKTFAPEAEIIQTIEAGSFTDFSVKEVPSDTTIAPAEPQTSGVPSRETQGSNKQRVQPDLQHTVTEKAAQEPAKPPALAKTVRVDVDAGH